MKFSETILKGSYLVEIEAMKDDRGWFARTFDKQEFKKTGFDGEWVQMNHSHTNVRGSVRGMHYQLPPFSETKLVRCIAGAVFDVIIDLRHGSNTFLKWFGTELSAENKMMLYIPAGFAHGFQAITDDCELIYHHSQYYEPGFEGGIKYDDPLIKIEWPTGITIVSERDQNHPYLDKNFEGIKIK
jgi:dTDP-4-dehydrorhamnose 3,5-epimerase